MIGNIFYGYTTRTKFSNRQTGILFLNKEDLNKTIEWNVSFAIANKRKHIQAWLQGDHAIDDTTGTCGLEGLIWAKNGLLEFEEFIKNHYLKSPDHKNHRITILWTNSKRKRVYVNYLKRYGYVLKIHYGKEFLIKDIFNNETETVRYECN